MDTIDNRFNLVDEPWIPVAGAGLVSLSTIFSDPSFRALGGNPVQKIAMTKLLLAIAQAAATPQDEQEWESLGPGGMAERVLSYLDKKKDCFWLYGERPFLQITGVRNAEPQAYRAVSLGVSSGNTTVLLESQVEKKLSDADKALLSVQLMGFGLGGKKTDNTIVLSPGYLKKPTGSPGASVGYSGFLHSFVTGENLLATIWVNLFTTARIKTLTNYPNGLGPIPWETPPKGESCVTATDLQGSLMGRLVPFGRFFYFEEENFRYSEGIVHAGYKEGGFDPSSTIDNTDHKALWVDPEKRPWRSLPAILGFLQTNTKLGFSCLGLEIAFPRVDKLKNVGLWSGGLRVSSNAGEQYVSGSDDFVESEVILPKSFLGAQWFAQLKLEMTSLDDLSKAVYSCCLGYQKALKAEGKKVAGQAANLFWQLAERESQHLIDSCGSGVEATKKLRKVFASYADQAYNSFCSQDTARQLDAWAAHRPQLGKYLA